MTDEQIILRTAILNGLVNQRLISSAEYQKMIAAGILHEDEQIELLEGSILEKTPDFKEPIFKAGIFINGIVNERLISAAEYQKMIAADILHEDERVELLEGRILEMSPKNYYHATATRRVNKYLNTLLGDRASISIQDPILLNDLSEPEPDVALVNPIFDETVKDHHPTPNDIFLIIEIADSSIRYDRNVKCPLYAQNEIKQFCILNLQKRELEDYRDPSGSEYKTKNTYSEEQSFNVAAFPDITIKVKDLLPPSPE